MTLGNYYYFFNKWIFVQSFLQNRSSSVWLDGEHLWTAGFRSYHTLSIGFRTGLWQGHSNTWICFVWNHSIVALALCLGLLSCWKVNLCSSLKSFADSQQVFFQDCPVFCSIHQLGPSSLSLLKRSSPRAWSCHLHVWQWGWCVQSHVQCLFFPHIAFCGDGFMRPH